MYPPIKSNLLKKEEEEEEDICEKKAIKNDFMKEQRKLIISHILFIFPSPTFHVVIYNTYVPNMDA
jgi:hypothetical protein